MISHSELYSVVRKYGVTTDSRDCPPGSVFIALHGENFDGNKFAMQALQKGCSYAIIDDPDIVHSQEGTVHSSPQPPTVHSELCTMHSELCTKLILVPDTLQALKDIAREHRRQFDIPVIAITGTNGKTTTKELVKAVLAEKFNVLATEGNFNNDVGVPKTLLRLRPDHQIAIIEMGASHPGDIKTLVETAEPTCGIITNVGRAHLQGFGSFEGVKRTKGELYDYLAKRNNALVFLNADNDDLLEMLDQAQASAAPAAPVASAVPVASAAPAVSEASAAPAVSAVSAVSEASAAPPQLWVTPYSTDPAKQYTCISGEVIHEEGNLMLKMRWRRPLMELEQSGASQKWHKVQTQLVGDYNADNVMAAIAVGINFGVDRKSICHALESYTPTNSRSQLVVTEKNRLIVDAYNANPTSMAAALENFLLMATPASTTGPAPLKKMVILGDMLELGAASADEHQKIADMLDMAGMEEAWLVGHEFAHTTNHYRKFADADEVKTWLKDHRPEGRLILIKGSNGTKLHQLPPLL